MRKTKPWLLAIAMLCCSLTASAEVVDGINYYFDSSSLTAEVTSSSPEYSGDIVIPESVTYNGNEYRVTSIGDDAFNSCYLLTSIEIPNSVMSIGSFAFRCSSLTSIVIPNSVTSIGDYAFEECSFLTSIEIPNSVTSIGSSAFYGCSGLTSIEIPNSVASIGQQTFEGCSSLTNIEIPNSVTNIGERTFYDTPWYNNQPDGVVYINNVLYQYKGSMPSNTSIEVREGTVSISSSAFSYCSSLTSIEIPNSVTSIGGYAFCGCSSLISIEIPSSVTSIGVSAFVNCPALASIVVDSNNLVYDSRDYCNAIIETSTNTLISGCNTTIIPNSVTSIGNYAFSYCSSLTSIEIPNRVTSIGDYAFARCSSLTNIEIPSSVTSIGLGAFGSCNSLTSIEIPSSVTIIEPRAFAHCSSLTSVTIGNGVTDIGWAAFYGCSSLTSVTIPNSVTSINSQAFDYCSSLTSVTIGSGVTIMDLGFFHCCNSLASILVDSNNPVYDSRDNCNAIIETATNTLASGCSTTIIPNSVTSIGRSAFNGCSGLTSIEIPNSVTSIGDIAFRGCSSLTSVTIGSGVTSIGWSAFDRCTALSSITCLSSTPPICNGSFPQVDKSIPVYVPNNTASAYQAAAEWSEFTNIIEMAPDYDVELSISAVGYATLYSAQALQLPEGVTAYYGKMSADNEWLNLYELADGKIPANTGVVLRGEEGTYGAWYLDEAPAAISGNALFGYTQDIPTSVITSIGFDVYTLAQEDGVVGFYKYNGETLKAGKAFLRLDRSIAQTPKMRIMGSETGISEIDLEPAADASVIYDLQGRRVSDMSRKGIYVVEGKKVIVK